MRSADKIVKDLVRSKSRQALRAGQLTETKCEICNYAKVEIHHREYLSHRAHLDVNFFCRLCHVSWHLIDALISDNIDTIPYYKRAVAKEFIQSRWHGHHQVLKIAAPHHNHVDAVMVVDDLLSVELGNWMYQYQTCVRSRIGAAFGPKEANAKFTLASAEHWTGISIWTTAEHLRVLTDQHKQAPLNWTREPMKDRRLAEFDGLELQAWRFLPDNSLEFHEAGKTPWATEYRALPSS